MTNNELKKEINSIAALYGVRVKFKKTLKTLGSCDFQKGIISIHDGDYSKATLYSVIFHEIGHYHCYINRIWPQYHYTKNYFKLTLKEVKAIRLTAFKAECWIEKWAASQMKLFYPRYKYRRYYGTPESRQWLMEQYLNRSFRI